MSVSYDSVEDIKAFADKSEISFPMLSDSESEMIKAYGVLNERARGRTAGIPHPVTLVIDSDLTVIARLDDTVTKRHKASTLIEAAQGSANNSDDDDGNDPQLD